MKRYREYKSVIKLYVALCQGYLSMVLSQQLGIWGVRCGEHKSLIAHKASERPAVLGQLATSICYYIYNI